MSRRRGFAHVDQANRRIPAQWGFMGSSYIDVLQLNEGLAKLEKSSIGGSRSFGDEVRACWRLRGEHDGGHSVVASTGAPARHRGAARAISRNVRRHRRGPGDGGRHFGRRGRGPRAAGVVASVGRGVWFDFFLTRPYDRFTISHRPDLETTIAILVVGVLVTELAGRSRRHWQSANRATAYVEMIHGVAVLAANSVPVEAMIEQDERIARRGLLTLRASRFDRVLSDPPLAQIQSNGDVALVGHEVAGA